MRRLFLVSSALFGMVMLGTTAPARAALLLAPVTYTFSGTCEDCTGFGTATMVLQPTMAGQIEFDDGNASLISFTYNSNLINAAVTSSQEPSFYANMVTVPGADDVSIGTADFTFTSYSDGFWCVNNSRCTSEVSEDFGFTHVWSAQTAVVTTPEPLSAALLGSGLVGVLLTRRSRSV